MNKDLNWLIDKEFLSSIDVSNGKTKSNERSKTISIFKTFRYATAYDIVLMVFGSIAAVVHASGWPLLSLVFGDMTNTLAYQTRYSFFNDTRNNQSSHGITRLEFESQMTKHALRFVYIGIGVLIASLIEMQFWRWSSHRQCNHMRQELLYSLMRHEIDFYDKKKFTPNIFRLIDRINDGIGEQFVTLIYFFANFILGFAVGLIKGWKLTVAVAVIAPLLALTAGFTAKLVSYGRSPELSPIGSTVIEVITKIKAVMALCGQQREINQFEDKLENAGTVKNRRNITLSIGFGVTFLFLYTAYAFALWLSSHLTSRGYDPMDIGSVFVILFSVMMSALSLANAVSPLMAILTARASSSSILKIIDYKPKIDAYSNDGIKPNNIEPEIEFQNVEFSFSSRKSNIVLSDINISIKPYSTVAICGPIGGGKSTLLNLLLRSHDVTNGKILIGKNQLTSLNVNLLRSIISIVTTDNSIFSGSVSHNIQMGSYFAPFTEIVDAAKNVNAHEFIMRLPNGYDTVVSPDGHKLHTHQKLLIYLARALIREPKLLLFDNIDGINKEVDNVLKSLMEVKRQTILIVPNKLSTITNADMIIVMNCGKVEESGTHEKLMANQGLYYNMVNEEVLINSYSHDVITQLRPRPKRTLSTSLDFEFNFDMRPDVITPVKSNVQITPSLMQILRVSGWRMLLLGSFASLFVGLTFPAFALLFAQIFDTLTKFGEEIVKEARLWTLMFIALGIISFLSHFLRTFGATHCGETLSKTLRRNIFTNILRQDISFFESGENLAQKITVNLLIDVNLIKSIAGHRTVIIITSMTTFLSSTILAIFFGWQLAIPLIVIMPILFATGGAANKIKNWNQKREEKVLTDATKTSTEAIEKIRVIQYLTQERFFFEKYANNLLVPYSKIFRYSNLYSLTYSICQSLIFFVYAMAFRFGAYLIMKHHYHPIDVYRIFFIIAFTAVSIGQWLSRLPNYKNAKLSAERVFTLIETKPEIDSLTEGGIKPKIKADVSIKNVHFRYPNKSNSYILRGVSFNVKTGKMLALVGPSGSGKSTLLYLMIRFFEANHGSVLIGGFDIRTLNLNHLRRNVCYLGSDPIIFSGTVRDNVIYGLEKEDITDAQIDEAIKIANLTEVIAQLPNGINTVVCSKEAHANIVHLTLGQKQQLAIARALVRNPKVLLIDEATCALDPQSEIEIHKSLAHIRNDKSLTCIVVAQRLSTLSIADQIAVIHDGKIDAIGTYEEIMKHQATIRRSSVTSIKED